ncbi:MAG TPA: hypothetical protein VF178_13610, partial [Gemmatimonadaceae bacterium]
AIAPTSIPRLAAVSLSWTSVVFALALAVVAGAVFGLIPLLRHRLEQAVLREEGRGLTMSRGQRTVRSGLVVGQIALALVLLAAAGLMFRSFAQLRSVSPGLDPRDVLVFDVSLPFTEYDTREESWAFHRALQQQLRALPGVVSVGSASDIPLEDFAICMGVFRERPPMTFEEMPCVRRAWTLPGFFETLRIPVQGRPLTWDDVDAATQATVITQALAERLWPGRVRSARGSEVTGPIPMSGIRWLAWCPSSAPRRWIFPQARRCSTPRPVCALASAAACSTIRPTSCAPTVSHPKH